MPFLALGAGAGDVIINEIVYDLKGADDKHEWVEIYNASPGDKDITGWKFNDGSNHLLNAPPKNGGQGMMIIPSGGYAVFADDAVVFLADHPGFSGTVIDSAFSLKNTEATLILLDKDGVSIDSVSYQKDLGGAGNGMTLERMSAMAQWKEGAQEGGTPGALNSGVSAVVPVTESVPPVAPLAPAPTPLPQTPIEQVSAPVSGATAIEQPIVAQNEAVPSETEALNAPEKKQTTNEVPTHTKDVAKKEDIGENNAPAVQVVPQEENIQKRVPQQPALASRAFGQSIYVLIAGAFGLVVWLSLRWRPAPVVEEAEREE